MRTLVIMRYAIHQTLKNTSLNEVSVVSGATAAPFTRLSPIIRYNRDKHCQYWDWQTDMTATDLHQRMLHQLDRVKALNTRKRTTAAQDADPKPHVSQRADAPEEQPHIPALQDAAPDAEPLETFSDDDDDRSEPRPEVSQQGLIVFTGQEKGLACEVMDLTTAGAGLRLADEVTVPSCFELTILPDNTVKTAQVCWRAERDLGIQFIEKD